MPCALTSSIPLDCRDSFGGIKEIKAKIHPGSTSNFTETSGVITVAGSGLTGWYTYGIEQETASMTDNPTGNRQNGTVFYAQSLVIIFNKLSTKVRNELKLQAQNRLMFSVKDQNDVYWLVGFKNGLMLTTGETGTGTAAGDRSGYSLTFEGQEPSPILNMSAATYDTLVTA